MDTNSVQLRNAWLALRDPLWCLGKSSKLYVDDTAMRNLRSSLRLCDVGWTNNRYLPQPAPIQHKCKCWNNRKHFYAPNQLQSLGEEPNFSNVIVFLQVIVGWLWIFEYKVVRRSIDREQPERLNHQPTWHQMSRPGLYVLRKHILGQKWPFLGQTS